MCISLCSTHPTNRMHDDKRKKRHMNLAQRISFYFFRENRVVIWGDTRERCSCSCKCPVPFSCFHSIPCHGSTAAALMAIKRFSNMQRIFTENIYWDLLAPVHCTITVTLRNLHAVLKAHLWKQNLHSKTMTRIYFILVPSFGYQNVVRWICWSKYQFETEEKVWENQT